MTEYGFSIVELTSETLNTFLKMEWFHRQIKISLGIFTILFGVEKFTLPGSQLSLVS